MQTFALLVLAADTVAQTDAPTIMGLVLQGLVALGGTVLTTVFGLIGAAINARAKDSKFASVLGQLWIVVQTSVAHAEAEIRPLLQKALADGSLSPEEGAALKVQVMNIVKASAGDQLQALVKSFGLPEGAVNTILSGLVERAVALLKVPTAPVVNVAAPGAPSATPPLAPAVPK